MDISKIKASFLSKAQGIILGKKYVVFLTGRRAIITDKQLNVITEIGGLFYVYKGELSPDETKLLLISNGTVFYVVDLNDFSLKRYAIKGRYVTNLEGIGCWDFNGNNVYILVDMMKKDYTELRSYSVNEGGDKTIVKVFNEYTPVCIKQVKTVNKYLIVFFDRGSEFGRYILMWFDGQTFSEGFLIGDESDDIDAFNVDVIEDEKQIIISGFMSSGRYDYEGKKIADITIDYQYRKSSFMDVFKNIDIIDDQNKKQLSEMVKNLGLDDMSYKEAIKVFRYSHDKKYLYIGTNMRLIIVDCETGEQLSKNVDYDVSQIEELDDHVILVSMDYSVKIYKIQP